ncbi:MAG TPA: hypothetical protein VJV78_03685 [Polyangiales bacterium]|nr:hypothetical protein [Polyangiales bacterium]
MVRQVCLDEINMYRATKMLPPLTRKMDQETCSDAGAKKDGDSMMGHSSAFSCRGSIAQNSCPGYPLPQHDFKLQSRRLRLLQDEERQLVDESGLLLSAASTHRRIEVLCVN